MRAIDADKLKASLRESYFELKGIRDGLNGEHDRNVAEGQMASFIEAILRVKNAPTIEVPTWIPVTERLPDAEYEARPEGTNYYAVIASRMTNVRKNGQWVKEGVVDKAWYDGEGFVDIVGIDISVGITHWMPLPTPPKDGE